jgi:hypothetical protein
VCVKHPGTPCHPMPWRARLLTTLRHRIWRCCCLALGCMSVRVLTSLVFGLVLLWLLAGCGVPCLMLRLTRSAALSRLNQRPRSWQALRQSSRKHGAHAALPVQPCRLRWSPCSHSSKHGDVLPSHTGTLLDKMCMFQQVLFYWWDAWAQPKPLEPRYVARN